MYLKKLSSISSLIILLVLAVLLEGCTPLTNAAETQEVIPETKNVAVTQDLEPVTKTEFLMGTIVKITIYDEVKEAETIFQKVFDRISEIEDKMTINSGTDKSEIIQLNNKAGEDYSKLSPDTFYVLEKGKYYSEISNGKYDITIGPLVKLWNIGTEEARLPKQMELNSILPLVNYENVTLDKENHSAKLNVSDMIVDLGSIAKGYAADEAAKILEEAGIKHAIINLGGNILTLNNKPDDTDWRLGLQDPLKPRGNYMGIIMLNDQALVSSGIYERYFDFNGKRYHHILNPKTGYPEENSIFSVSIITKYSIDADGLSTTIFLLGLEEGMKMIEDLPDTEAIFITSDKKVYQSSGIDENNFEIINEEYQLQSLEVIK